MQVKCCCWLYIISLYLLIAVNSADLDYGRKLPLHVTMLPNPSHLDAVDPVITGKARGRQLTLKDGCYSDLPDCQMGDKVTVFSTMHCHSQL